MDLEEFRKWLEDLFEKQNQFVNEQFESLKSELDRQFSNIASKLDSHKSDPGSKLDSQNADLDTKSNNQKIDSEEYITEQNAISNFEPLHTLADTCINFNSDDLVSSFVDGNIVLPVNDGVLGDSMLLVSPIYQHKSLRVRKLQPWELKLKSFSQINFKDFFHNTWFKSDEVEITHDINLDHYQFKRVGKIILPNIIRVDNQHLETPVSLVLSVCYDKNEYYWKKETVVKGDADTSIFISRVSIPDSVKVLHDRGLSEFVRIGSRRIVFDRGK